MVGSLRQRNFEMTANIARGVFLHLPMSRNRRDFAVGRVFPKGGIATLALETTAVLAQVPFELAEFHRLAGSNSR